MSEEYFDILNDDGTLSGRKEKRSDVHKYGYFHASTHIWVIRYENDKVYTLIQKRSKDKDSFPSCYDASCTGHISSDEGVREGAVRELFEEIGIEAEENELEYITDIRVNEDNIFHGKRFLNNEVQHIFMLERDIPAEDIKYQKSEIESVCWIDMDTLMERLKNKDSSYGIKYIECCKVYEYIRNRHNR